MGTVWLQTNRISLKPNEHPGQDVFINITSTVGERPRGTAASERGWITVPKKSHRCCLRGSCLGQGDMQRRERLGCRDDWLILETRMVNI